MYAVSRDLLRDFHGFRKFLWDIDYRDIRNTGCFIFFVLFVYVNVKYTSGFINNCKNK